MLRLHEDVEILRVAIDAGVLVDRVRARDDVGNPVLVERTERSLVHLTLGFRNPEVAVSHRLSLFLGEVVHPRDARRAPSVLRHRRRLWDEWYEVQSKGRAVCERV